MIEELIFKSTPENLGDAKDSILKCIQAAGTYSVSDGTQSISNTDWHLANPNREYWSHAIPFVGEHNEKLIEHYRLNGAQVENFWFQQYEKGDYHNWHNHSGCCFSSVFYVELGDNAPSTTFRWMGRSFEVPVQEGDILSFPSFVAHGSKANKGSRKTIISYNTRVTVIE